MQNDRCLACGRELGSGEVGYHDRCARDCFGAPTAPAFSCSVEDLNEMAKKLVLSRMSVPGVQAKLSVHLERAAAGSDRLTLVGLDGDFILKLPSKSYPELPEGEHCAMTFARLCGIDTAAFSLIRLASGSLAYITRRMDRENGVRHMIDFCQLTERRTSRKYFGSHEQIARTLRRYSSSGGVDVIRFFNVALFSFLTGNSDMHLKNFSMLRSNNGVWRLSPAYDLVPVRTILPTDLDDLALTLNGKNRNLRRGDFLAAGETAGLTSVQCKRLIDRMSHDVGKNLDEALERSFLSAAFRERFRKLVASNLARLNG